MSDIAFNMEPNEWIDTDDNDLDDAEDDPFISPVDCTSDTEAECLPILLPSTIGRERCINADLAEIVEKERTLRQGQANDALQGVRMALGKKSFLFRTRLRNSTSKGQKLRSWSDIAIVEAGVRHQAKIYRKARRALIALGASEEIMNSYQVLKKEHLCTSTTVVDPNARGQRNASLAWFWSMDIAGDSARDDIMVECALTFFYPSETVQLLSIYSLSGKLVENTSAI